MQRGPRRTDMGMRGGGGGGGGATVQVIVHLLFTVLQKPDAPCSPPFASLSFLQLCASAPSSVEADAASFGGAWLQGFGGEAEEDRRGREEEAGYFLYRLHLLYRAAHGLLVAPSSAPSSSAAATAAELSGGANLLLLSGTGSEWRNFQADLLELASPTSGPGRKRVLAERMGRVYACLQPVAPPARQ